MANGLDPRFICTSDLQELLRDKDSGLPLSGGIITFYSQTNPTQLKPVYQLNYINGDYKYNPLPNPCQLSIAGTFQDELGNDIVPYYYPFEGTPDDDTGIQELYYITVKNSALRPQFTRNGWPQSAGGSSPSTNSSVYNFVRNAQFYGWSYLPSNATGFKNTANTGAQSIGTVDCADDWTYSIDDSSQTININRVRFDLGQTAVPANPVYYFQYQNTNVGSGLAVNNVLFQTYKSVQTLSGQTVTISFWMQSSLSSTIEMSVQLNQYFGSGGSPSATVVIPVLNITQPDNTEWNLYSAQVSIPAVSQTATLGSNNDDCLQLIFNLPKNLVININLANVLMTPGETVFSFPVNSNNDQYRREDTVTPDSIFKTGDIKMTLRNISDTGWLLMDDRTIGNLNSGATHVGNTAFNLFCLIWNNVNSIAWAPLYDSSGVPLASYGASATADWEANRQIGLTKALGRVFAGSGTSYTNCSFIATNNGGILGININQDNIMVSGNTFQVSTGPGGTLPTGLSPATTYYAVETGSPGLYYVATTRSNAVAASNAITNSMSPAAYVIAFTNAGTTPNFLVLNAMTWALGQAFGEQNHTLEPYQVPSATIGSGSGGTGIGTSLTFAMNVMQPTTFMNVMIKL